jgi:integrase
MFNAQFLVALFAPDPAAPVPRYSPRDGRWSGHSARHAGKCYNRAMTLTPSPPITVRPPSSTWDRLTEADATRVAAAVAANHAEATRKVYAHAWREWVRWCAGRGLMPFPGQARRGVRLSNRARRPGCVAVHRRPGLFAEQAPGRRHGAPDPIDRDAVRQVHRGLRRIVGKAPRRPARPLGGSDLRQNVTAIDRTTPRGIRDSALILLGFAGALRGSELAALTLADLEAKPAGLLLHLRGSKTDPERRGQVVGIAHGEHALIDPIAALDAWLAVRGTAPGPAFTSLRPGIRTLQPISGNAVTSIVKDRAAAAGLSAERITAHSLRAGHATSAALAGVGVDRIAAQTRHRRTDVLVER